MRRRPVSVIEFAAYERRADELLTDAEQAAVVDLVAFDPTCGDLIAGTGGLRKVHWAQQQAWRRAGHLCCNADPVLLGDLCRTRNPTWRAGKVVHW
jgi:hypothetical protein